MGQVDESSTDALISSCWCDYDDTLRAKDEENFSTALESEDDIKSASIRQESLVPSTYPIEASSLEQCVKALELVMHADGGSNVYLVNADDVFHNEVPCEGLVTGTGEIESS